MPPETFFALFEDERIIRDTLREAVAGESWCRWDSEFSQVDRALEYLSTWERSPGVVVIDCATQRDRSGWHLVEFLGRLPSRPRMIVICARLTDHGLAHLSRHQVSGVIDKLEADVSVWASALRAVAEGKLSFSGATRERLHAFKANSKCWTRQLTSRETSMLPLFGRGLDDEEIAATVGLAAATVHTHRKNVMRKVGISTSARLVRWVVDRGIA